MSVASSCSRIALALMLAAAACVVRANREPRTDCTMTLGGVRVKEEILLRNLSLMRYLAVDHLRNILYFGYLDQDNYVSAKMNLITKEYETIEELSGYCTHTVDQNHHLIYAGCYNYTGHGGLYQYDSNAGKFVYIGEQKQNVRFVFYKDGNIYYTKGPYYHIYSYAHGRTRVVDDLDASGVWNMIIDKDDNWIFYNLTGMHQKRSGGLVTETIRDEIWVNDLEVDAHGVVYMCDWDNLFVVNPINGTFTVAIDDLNCDSLAFDRDNNLIFTDKSANFIVRLLKCE